eukprot:gene2826-5554_t
MRLEQISHGAARLYFVDNDGAQINIPNEIVVYDNTFNVPCLPISRSKIFILVWSDSYCITFRGETILEMFNQRQWELRGPIEIIEA